MFEKTYTFLASKTFRDAWYERVWLRAALGQVEESSEKLIRKDRPFLEVEKFFVLFWRYLIGTPNEYP